MTSSAEEPGEDRAVQVVADLAARAAPRCGDVLVVAVDGPSGAGKTTLARALGRRLGARVVHMDDVYPGWDGLADAVPLVVEGLLEPFARGEDAAYRRWDWVHDRWATRRRDVRWTPRLVLEGVGSSVGTAGAFAGLRVWVEAPRAVRFERGIARDGESYRPHWERWARQEAAMFAADRTRSRADVVVDTTGAHRGPR